MKKKQELTIEEAFVEIYATSYQFTHDNTLSFINFYNEKCKMLRHEIIEHEENEPFKFLKKTHKNWEIKKDKLQTEFENTFNRLMKEYAELESIINLSSSSN